MTRSETSTLSEGSRIFDFEQPWHSQSKKLSRLCSRDATAPFANTLFTQYDLRFGAQRRIKRCSRPPIPSNFMQDSASMEIHPRPYLLPSDPCHSSRYDIETPSPPRPLHKARSVSDSGSSTARQVEAAKNLAKEHRQKKMDKKRREEDVASMAATTSSIIPISGGYFDDNGEEKEEEDSEVDELCLVKVGKDSMASLAFPIPPRSHVQGSVRQVRSLASVANRYNEEEDGFHNDSSSHNDEKKQNVMMNSTPKQSPLRQRRCKLPLSIKTVERPSQQLRRRKSSISNSSIHSPPPCPPPATPLPDIPLSCSTFASRIKDNQGNQIDEFEAKNFALESKINTNDLVRDLDWDWNQSSQPASSASITSPPFSSSSSSSSSSTTSPASSRGSTNNNHHHHHHHSNSHLSFPITPCNISNPLPSLATKEDDRQLQHHQTSTSPNLALYFAFQHSLDQNKGLLSESNNAAVESQDDIDDDNNHYVYGFAL